MKYYIGIDAGGTKSKCILVDENKKLISESIDGSGAFLIHGIQEVAERFLNCIMECIQKAKISYTEIESIVIGCAGAGGDQNANNFRNGFLKHSLSVGINFKNVIVTSDAVIALEGTFSGKPGAILIAGTGSILLGKNEDNKIIRIGGAGRIVGDEGSGFRLGQQGLNSVYKYFDGRGSETSLVDIFNTELDIVDMQSLIEKIYSEKLCPSKIAPLIIREAEKGDEISINIVEEQALELAKHIQTMRKNFSEKLRIAFFGGLLNNPYYNSLVKKLITILAPDVEVVDPENTPEYGAILLGINQTKII